MIIISCKDLAHFADCYFTFIFISLPDDFNNVTRWVSHMQNIYITTCYIKCLELNNMHRKCKIVFHIALNIFSNRQTKVLLPHPLSCIKLGLMPVVSLHLKFSCGILGFLIWWYILETCCAS